MKAIHYILIALIVAVAIFGVGYMSYKAKQDLLTQQRAENFQREVNLSNCRARAEESYHNYWNSQCPFQGLDKTTDGCSLPRFIALGIEERREKALENCTRMYSK